MQGAPDSGVGTARSVDVSVSYDDGRTWKPVALVGGRNTRVALLRHPSGHGFASLRAKAALTSGTTVDQTVIHAYRY